MKKLIVFALVAFAGVCSASLASAQARQVQGQIPFDFTAGSARLSAGEYRITYENSGLVTFRNLDRGRSVLMFVGAEESAKDGSCKLIFTHYGDQYFLKQSACSTGNVNFSVPTSPYEKDAPERAATSHDDEQMVVAMK